MRTKVSTAIHIATEPTTPSTPLLRDVKRYCRASRQAESRERQARSVRDREIANLPSVEVVYVCQAPLAIGGGGISSSMSNALCGGVSDIFFFFAAGVLFWQRQRASRRLTGLGFHSSGRYPQTV